jgi:hypothetical protein
MEICVQACMCACASAGVCLKRRLFSCVAQKYLPLDLRPKKTRAIRRQMTKHEVCRGAACLLCACKQICRMRNDYLGTACQSACQACSCAAVAC